MSTPEPDFHDIAGCVSSATAEIIRDLALASAKEAAKVDTADPSAFIVPVDARLEVIDPARFDKLNSTPRRAEGIVQPQTLEALINYVDYHHDIAATTVWVGAETGKVIAVINDHAGADGAPGWGDHRAIFEPRMTPEWLRWKRADGSWLEQEAFAELLEDGLTEIAEPAGATLLEVASTMSGKTEVSWEQATRLDNGAISAKYVEDVKAGAGARGDLEIPTQFTLVLPVFAGEDAIQIEARLRWRLRAGKLLLGFKLDNPHRAVQESVDRISDQLAGPFSHVYIGTPR